MLPHLLDLDQLLLRIKRMKIKHYIVTCVVFFFLPICSAYSQVVKGITLDSSNTPIPFATLAFLNKSDSTIINGIISDENGVFEIKVDTGIYLLKTSAIGFDTKCCDLVSIQSNSIDNSIKVILSKSPQTLNEITVNAIRSTVEFKNGNITVNIENSPLAKGNTVYDLFFKMPGVSVDNNLIYLNGKPGVSIMIDGRLQQISNSQLLNLLKSMNAEAIEKIELFKNPPAKYDASGTSGIINIKTKKSKVKGFNGSTYTSFSQGFYPRTSGGILFNYKSNRILFFSNLDFNYNYYHVDASFDRKFTTDSSITELITENVMKELESGLNYKIGTDWSINKNNIVGFKVEGGPGSFVSNSTGITRIHGENTLNFDHLNSIVNNPDKWLSNNFNLNSEHHFDSLGTVLNFSSDYTLLSEIVSSNIKNIYMDKNNMEVLPSNMFRNNNDNKTVIFASKVDFNKYINDKTSVQFGAKTSYIKTENNYIFERYDNASLGFNNDTSLSNNYLYEEQTYAAYINVDRKYKNVNLQLGIRAENTNLEGRNTNKGFQLKQSYYNLFPNVSLEYSPSEKHNFQANFNRRIDRPQYGDLNPFRYFRDQYQFYEGNPFLLPHYSNNIELSHSFKKIITNSLTYTRIENVMLHYTSQDDSTKIFTESIKNMRMNNIISYLMYIQKDLTSWWRTSLNANISYIEYQGDINGERFKTASLFYNPSLINTFLLPKSTKIEILSFFRSGKNNGLVQVRPRWMITLAVKKSFLDGKLDCSIGIDDIFYTGYFRTWAKFKNQDWNYKVTQDTRRLTISINYNFGKSKFYGRETSSNDQEKGRLNH